MLLQPQIVVKIAKNTMLKNFWLAAYSLVSADVMALAAMSLSADVPAELFEGNTVAEMSL